MALLAASILEWGLRSKIDSIGLLTITFGIWVFWTHGGPRITGAGLYCLAMSFYAGFASLWWTSQGGESEPLYIAALTGWWTTLAMWALFWRRQSRYPPQLRPKVPTDVTAWVIRMGLLGTAVGAGTAALQFGNAAQFALGGLLLLVLGLMLHRAPRQQVIVRLALSGVVVFAFFEAASDGRGRLNLITLALVATVLASTKVEARHLKGIVVLASAPALWLLVSVRARLGVEETGSEYDGLGSVVNPLDDFATIVAALQEGHFTPVGWDPFIATIFFWVPRSLWADKPEGVGRQLVATFEPDLLSTNHSMAAHAYGEWLFSFGWVGVVFMIPAIGLLVRSIDSAFLKLETIRTRRDILKLGLLVALISTTPTLAWVGTFTFASRVGQQLLLLAVIALPSATRKYRSHIDER